jgi:hypothetical protein
MKRSFAYLVFAATTLVGCGDPLVGDWKAQQQNACGSFTTFQVIGDLSGTGTTGCNCNFTFTTTEPQPGSYTVNINFDNSCFIPDGNYTCTLRANDEELDCGILGQFDRAQ